MLRKVLIAIGIFFGLLVLSAISVALLYEEQVKKIIISQINKQLVAPVQVGEIQFSLLKNFPKASLSFYHVNAKSVYSGNEKINCPKTLFNAKEISLQFNLMDLFKGNYTINKLVIDNAHLFLFIDKEQLDNYHCWKSDTSKSNTAVSFKINQIFLNQFQTNYIETSNHLRCNVVINDALMKGEVFDEDFAVILNADLKINQFEYEKTSYFSNKKVELQLGLLKKNKAYSFNEASAIIEKLKLKLSGTYLNNNINFEANGKDLDIQSFISLLPEKWSNKFVEYQSNGKFALGLTLKGKLEKPGIKAVFDIANANIKKSSSKFQINNLNVKGYYSNGHDQTLKTSGVYVNTFSAKINQSPIHGSFSIVDFTAPFLDGNIKAQVELAAIKEIFALDTFKILEGDATINLRISSTIQQLREPVISQTKPGQISGELQIINSKIQFVNDLLSYENMIADLYADDNYILVKQLSFTHGKSQLELQGELSNYQTFFNKRNEKAILRAYFNSDNFELEDWLPKNQSKGTSNVNKSENNFNNFELKLQAKISKFKFDQFYASNLKSQIYFSDNRFRFDSLSFQTMDGRANANGAIDLQENGGFDLICDAKLTKISIDKLFEQLNNFGQKTLTNKNLAGKLSAEIKYKSSWNNLNSIIEESILADATVLIVDGELINFTPMNKLSKFVSVNELSHIKFKELENTISISNKKIYIPQFEIKSSAMNLYCSGTHDFDNNIDYHFKVTLNELLSKKRRREVPKNSEFDEMEEDEKGKTTLFISMTGNMDNPKIKFDKKELKKFVKDEIKNEKQTVKQLLKEEFGLFKKDKNLKESTDKKTVKSKDFEVEWEEAPIKEIKPQPSNPDKKKHKLFGGDNTQETPKEKSKPKKEENSDDYL
ncbi:MAG TPA: AsmA-like C-terminal region-containing protein [Bacteroidia bacterium]|nr:AsmA-like C-terminal region-containing protein [Bacteroidia bacterium]